MLLPPLGVIEVIHTASMGTSVSWWKGVLSVVSVENDREDAQGGGGGGGGGVGRKISLMWSSSLF